ncbi:MAG: hypothetical protein WA947_06360 [Phormidesmis sp.]
MTDLLRLWFILAVATLYVTAQGLEVVQLGRRRWIISHRDPELAMASRPQQEGRSS